jgi:hypothetical protein
MEKPHKPKLQPFLGSGEIVESDAIDDLGLMPITPPTPGHEGCG